MRSREERRGRGRELSQELKTLILSMYCQMGESDYLFTPQAIAETTGVSPNLVRDVIRDAAVYAIKEVGLDRP